MLISRTKDSISDFEEKKSYDFLCVALLKDNDYVIHGENLSIAKLRRAIEELRTVLDLVLKCWKLGVPYQSETSTLRENSFFTRPNKFISI